MSDEKIKKENKHLKVVDFPQDNSVPIIEKMLEDLKKDTEVKGVFFVKIYADGIEYVSSSFLEIYTQHVIAAIEKIKFDILMNNFTTEDIFHPFIKPPSDDDPPKAS